jgi:hypothetical protein
VARATAEELLASPSLAARLAEEHGCAVPFALAQQAELDEIESSRRAREAALGDAPAPAPTQPPHGRYAPRAAFSFDLMGLAFSGGGIRSATFNLGVLQALADLRLLRYVDYQSTVSGGGYIGSWAASWVKRVHGGVLAVQDRLSPVRTPDPNAPPARPIRFLREYSSYLTPERGLLGADTWTLVGIWFRNLLLVQTVLLLFLSAVLLLPINVGLVLSGSERWPAAHAWVAGAAGAALFVLLCLQIAAELARFVKEDARRTCEVDDGWATPATSGTTSVLRWIVSPGFLCAVLLALAFWSWARPDPAAPAEAAAASARLKAGEAAAGLEAKAAAARADAAAAAATLTTVEIAVFAMALFALGVGLVGFRAGYARDLARRRRLGPFAAAVASIVVPALLGAVLAVGLALLYASWRGAGAPWHVVTFGPPLMALIVSLVLVAHVGLVGRDLADDRREWVSRLTAWLLIWSALWLTLFVFAVYMPRLFSWAAGWARARYVAAGGLAWLASTAWGAYIAAGAPPPADRGEKRGLVDWRALAVAVAPYLFLVGFMAAIACAIHVVLARLHGWMDRPVNAASYWERVAGFDPLATLFAMALFAGLTALAAWRVDVNEFSMHHFYKNRLVRCYLGASREGSMFPREAHPFTGFDSDDDVRLATLRARPEAAGTGPLCDAERPPYVGPLPVVCAALNVVKGDDLAWQERKAQSFVFTPHFSGFEHLPIGRGSADGGGPLRPDGFRPTRAYGYPDGGIRLGTAMAISGAAANPNMGYHSSPVAAFLMTMFNVRLGWWMGNPRHDGAWRYSSPRFGLAALVDELTSNTTNRSRFVNLSDGGHFDNLGVYELVRRRCRFIVCGDAEEDQGFTFGGLGGVVRKCRTDFGVEIRLFAPEIFKREAMAYKVAHFALGEIQYPGGETGWLLYLKSSLTGDEPGDVLEYSWRMKAFPHESTADQWFDESQFESYRQLGYHIVHHVLGAKAYALWRGGEPGPGCWRQLFDALLAERDTRPRTAMPIGVAETPGVELE